MRRRGPLRHRDGCQKATGRRRVCIRPAVDINDSAACDLCAGRPVEPSTSDERRFESVTGRPVSALDQPSDWSPWLQRHVRAGLIHGPNRHDAKYRIRAAGIHDLLFFIARSCEPNSASVSRRLILGSRSRDCDVGRRHAPGPVGGLGWASGGAECGNPHARIRGGEAEWPRQYGMTGSPS
jgi:hypothetical protein